MGVAIAIISPVIVLVIVFLIFYRISRRTHIYQRPRWVFRLYILVIVLYTVTAWLFYFDRSSVWAVLNYIAGSALFGGILMVSVTNWRGWRKHLWKSADSPFPRDARSRVIALTVASLGLFSDLVLLILLVAR